MISSLKPSQALNLLHGLTLAQVRSDMPDLTNRQLTILLTIYLEAPPHTVRGLAERLRVTKPVITRALDTMGALKFVSRHRDPRDRRNVIIARTVEGSLYLERLADLVIEKAKRITP